MRIIPILRNIFLSLVIACAWLVACVSVAFLIYIVYSITWVDPNNTGAFFRTASDGVTRTAWGLSYRGVGGSLMAFFEACLLLAALWASTRPSDLKRRAGLLLLFFWSLLLLGAGTWVFRNAYAAPFTIPALLVSIGRAIACWGSKRWDSVPA